MNGIQILLNAFGISPETADQMQKDIPEFFAHVRAKVDSIDASMRSLAERQEEQGAAIIGIQKRLDVLMPMDEMEDEPPHNQLPEPQKKNQEED